MEVHVQSTDWNHQQNIRARYQLADESQNCSDCSNYNDHLEGFWICGCHVYGRPVLTSGRCHGAAQVDGASGWQKFRYITLPLLKPMTLFVVITSIISYIQAYVQILIMTEGGPGTSTYLASYIIYDEAFVKYNFGYASALSFVLFVITAVLTVLSFKVSGKEE